VPADLADPERPVVFSSPRSGRRGGGASDAASGARSRRGNRRGVWIAVAVSLVLVLAAGAFAVWATSDRTDETDDAAGGSQTTSDAASPTVATSDGVTASTAATTPSTTEVVPPPSNSAATPGVVEVGQAVRFTLPVGYTESAVGPGVEITDGTLRFYAQVGNRPPGEDPLVVLQEYVNGFDALYASASYSQAIPEPLDTSGAAAVDGYVVYYRVMAVDGTGYKGVIDATRRADGLVSLTDLYTPLADASGSVLPAGVADELYNSFLQTPSVGPVAELGTLPVARLTSVHPSFVLDGMVAVTPPAGWAAELPGPGRVAVSHPGGERFVAARLADTSDPLAAQDAAFADLQALWPGATMSPFVASRETGPVASYDAAFTAPNVDGTATEGVVRVWIDLERAQVFDAIASGIADAPAQPGHREFLFSALDIALTQPR
jgi:hypothetical protein